MTVDAIIAGVETAPDEPFPEGGIARIQRRVPIVVPVEEVGIFFEALREALLTEPFINLRIARIRLSNKLRRRGIVLLLLPVNGDLILRDLYLLFFFRHYLNISLHLRELSALYQARGALV